MRNLNLKNSFLFFKKEPEQLQFTPDSLKDQLKSYVIRRDDNFFGFGIILHTDKEIFPKLEVEPKSPAVEAGLQNDQRLIAVNNKYLNRDFKTITALAQEIDDSYYQRGYAEFLVLDADIWALVEGDQELVDSLSNDDVNNINNSQEVEYANVPLVDKATARLCSLTRDSKDGQYGFDFKTLKSEGRHVATNVRDGFPAQKAGLKNSDYILEVNGKSIDGMEHEAVVNLIFANPKQVNLLVVEDYKAYKKSKKDKSKEELANVIKDVIYENESQQQKEDGISRHRISLIPAYKGIGLHLNYNGIINYIEPLSPAEAAGLIKDQTIVEVNGVNVRGKNNREIAKIIKDHQDNLIIGVENPPEKPEEDSLGVEIVTPIENVIKPERVQEENQNSYVEEPIPVYPIEKSQPSTYSKQTGKEIKGKIKFYYEIK